MSSGSPVSKKVQVALVDDSSVIRGALTRILQSDPNIEVISSVQNGELGIVMARTRPPDVMILDIEMPVMDGLTALPEILKVSPKTKVIMCSTLTEKGATVTMKAFSLGAVEAIQKPSSAIDTGPNSPFQRDLLRLVRNLGGLIDKPGTASPIPATADMGTFTLRNNPMDYRGKPSILAIGSSTGGPQALFKVLTHFKNFDIPIVITQHMPATFTKILAGHIGIPAQEGENGMIVENGHIYVAPGGKHMLFVKEGTSLKIKLDDGPPENFCKPAVDPMLRSLIEIYGNRILCVILTGMGSDGALGAKSLMDKGGRIIAQDKATSVVWGMPGAAAMAGVCSAVLPVDQIGPWVLAANKKA
jgi:two-component system, chemotaxis family, protein-glutamate methylesterase/glutaminase